MSNISKAALINAILAMDSYNRGYKPSIKNITAPANGAPPNVGHWTLSQDSFSIFGPAAEAIGFYAISYTNALTHETVISYRGSDTGFGGVLPGLINKLFGGSTDNDVINGYGVALGYPDGPQALMALGFYRAIAGKDAGAGKTLVTGHSLGGGLAGFVGSIFGENSVLFDPMPYRSAVAAARRDYDDSINPVGDTARAQLIQLLSGSSNPPQFNAGTTSGYYIPASFYNILTSDNRLDSWRHSSLNIVDSYISAQDNVLTLPSDLVLQNTSRNAVGQKHSVELEIFRMFADLYPEFGGWEQAADLWIPATFDEAVGEAAGAVNFDATGKDRSGTMRTAIAYSALGDGTAGEGDMVFGDTAIWSMFNDAQDLGRALAAGGAPFLNDTLTVGYETRTVADSPVPLIIPIRKTISQILADMLVQYAGALGFEKVSQAKVDNPHGKTDVRQGMLAYTPANDGKSGVLSVDLSSVVWSKFLKDHARSPLEGAQFREAFFKDAAGSAFTDALKAFRFTSADDLAKTMWDAKDASVIDRFDIAVGAGGGTYDITERNYKITNGRDEYGQLHADIFVGTTGNDRITGTKGGDILIGNGGSDTIDAGDGNDVVVANGDRNALTIGGLGQDRIYNISVGGEIWGDKYASILYLGSNKELYDHRFYLTPVLDGDGNDTGKQQRTFIADDKTNADYFVWSGGTRIKDAQYHDRLFFAGIPLIGGNDTGGMVGAIFSAFTGGLGSSAIALAQAGRQKQDTLYTDDIMPFITYKMVGNALGGYDLHVSNILTGFVDAFEYLTGDTTSGLDEVLKRYLGTMSIDDFISPKDASTNTLPIATSAGDLAKLKPGKLGLTFKKTDPRTIALALWSALDPFYATAAGGVNAPLVDQAITALFYARKFSTALKWTASTDPLVLDLSGLGLQTLSLDGSGVTLRMVRATIPQTRCRIISLGQGETASGGANDNYDGMKRAA